VRIPYQEITDLIIEEVTRAKRLYPSWPADPIRRVALMAEEAGEAVREANNLVYDRSCPSFLLTELVQTAAMCYRNIEHLLYNPDIEGPGT